MAGETSSDSGAADRSTNTETGRADDPWRRIEAERPQREAARKAWDAEHDPSPEFEYAIRPLGNDYGRDRPKHRELTEEQRAELAEVFGRPADELLALRDKDPRAGHNRDDQGRILGPDGTPRPERTPEEILREAQRQADLYSPNAKNETADDPADPAGSTQDDPEDAPELQAPSEQPDEGHSDNDEPDERADDARPTKTTDDQNADDQTADVRSADVRSAESAIPPEIHEQLGNLAAELRAERITPDEAADQLEKLRPALERSAQAEPEAELDPEPGRNTEAEREPETEGTVPYDEPTTKTVDTRDGLTYQRPERQDSPDILESPRDNRLSQIMRTSVQRGDDLLDSADEFYENMVDGLKPTAVQPSPSWDTPHYAHIQGKVDQSAGTALVVTLLVAATAQGIRHRRDNRSRPPSEEDR